LLSKASMAGCMWFSLFVFLSKGEESNEGEFLTANGREFSRMEDGAGAGELSADER